VDQGDARDPSVPDSPPLGSRPPHGFDRAQVVAGLGNPGPEYQRTRHNVGQRVLDVLARRLACRWHRERRAVLAPADRDGRRVYLVKPVAFMNASGPAIADTLRDLVSSPGDLILVYDDLDLPLGTVRVRLSGGHGGHRGVQSVLETLATTDIRRVRIGIGRPERKEDIAEHVLSPFEPDELPVVETAADEAADRVLTLLGSISRADR
jgi:peptidyl-tRNA hydrolase, PTH1 family